MATTFRAGWPQSFRYLLIGSLLAAFLLYALVVERPSFHFRPYHRTAPEPVNTSMPLELDFDDHLPPFDSNPNFEIHPIDDLVRQAQRKQKKLLEKQVHTVPDAAAAYRKRRGRHPPPGFDVWVREAMKRKVILVEDFFDRIYHDTNPFWALEPKDLRVSANSYFQTVRVRSGNASFDTDDLGRVPWIQLWTGLVAEAAPHLPDVDMPINYMDETRLLVPFEQMDEYSRIEKSRRKMLSPDEVITSWPEAALKEVDAVRTPWVGPAWIKNEAPQYWNHYRNSCPPDTPAAIRNLSAVEDFASPIDFPTGWPEYSHHGYINNFTRARDPCYQPHLRGMHGTFVESISMSTSHELIPLFGGSKLPMNNEILLPPAMYLSEEARYSGGNHNKYQWEFKHNKVMWRGTASGGRNRDYDWQRFQRHRLMQVLNGTAISDVERTKNQTKSFELPKEGLWEVNAQRDHRLGEWISEWADAGFVHLECYPAVKDGQGDKRLCSYTDPYFKVANSMLMEEQFAYKYLPDVDGNSYSGRYRSFLLSSSLPIKATIYSEWHDDRLMPWVHFVPMDNSYLDLYGIMNYFLNGHDMVAHRIASEGRAWAEKVLRREDMLMYVWRVLLEFARICDDDRDELGYVGDLVKEM
jgi:Glycosyl transferase family 90